jgi:branched-chain amino acid transport system ATP-binding protein
MASDPSPPVLSTVQLSKRFGGVVAADRIDFNLRRGELRCVIGPNGAGKSTFFALLCGILRPDAGQVFVHGRNVTHLPAFRRVRLGLGLTFQTNRAFHALTVAENLETARRGAAGGGGDDAHFRTAYAAFGLAEQPDLPAKELPHHQLQWLEICMALRPGPQILLLDEPTAGMSPEETRAMMDLIVRLAGERTVILVEHKMKLVMSISDRLLVLHHGELLAEGTPDDIRANETVRRVYLGQREH